MKRRDFVKAVGLGAAALALPRWLSAGGAPPAMPNIILCMCDDLGWFDTGFNGNTVIKTPNLDEMARHAIRFTRWYSGAPVCSPTRGSCLTGRHPYRYGITFANVGCLPREEITVAEAVKTRGYVTAHFGKWHLGTLTKTEKDANRGKPGDAKYYSPPWEHGFDVCLSTESKVPTWDPMKAPGSDKPYGTYYWKEDGTKETQNLDGDDSRIIMDRVIPFIRGAVKAGKPFLAVVWFHTPHEPVVAGPKYLAMYGGRPAKDAAYYGAVTAMDEQFGRMRKELKDLGIADNTMLWFSSDNGPEGKAGQAPGSAGPLRGRKRDLFEGGVRVPGLVEWPARIKAPRVVDVPGSTCDYYPTILDVLGFKMKGQPMPIDGVSLLGLIEGRMTARPAPIGFQSPPKQISLTDNRYKLISLDEGKTWMLFDLAADIGEKTDLAAAKPDVVKVMAATLVTWRASCKDSLEGKDYHAGGLEPD